MGQTLRNTRWATNATGAGTARCFEDSLRIASSETGSFGYLNEELTLSKWHDARSVAVDASARIETNGPDRAPPRRASPGPA